MTASNPRPKQVILAAVCPVGSNQTIWTDSRAGGHIDFAAFKHIAQTAERGMFDFFFLTELLRLRESDDRVIHDLDVAGSPDIVTLLSGLAAVTEHIGLVATNNVTFNEPYDLARQLATLDQLSGGRVGWNVVTTSNGWVGENFRRGGYLDYEDRYLRAGEFLDVCRALWESWAPDAVRADQEAGVFVPDEAVAPFSFYGRQFGIQGDFILPRTPQVHPVLLQAGDSGDGREFAAKQADAIFCRPRDLDEGREFYADVKRRMARYGRGRDDLKILPGSSYVLGDTEQEARELAEHVRRQQVTPASAIATLEKVWGRDLSGYDPEGPLPDVDPVGHQGRAAKEWRKIAQKQGLGIRDLVVEMTSMREGIFVGTASSIADQMIEFVRLEGADGFVLAPYLQPTGLDEFVDRVVPELQERGALRTDYASTRLRDHLGLREARTAGTVAAPPQTTGRALGAERPVRKGFARAART
jgi:FMN-dependent oxidoreductase (nitrilotriacetate monooxygenase family)